MVFEKKGSESRDDVVAVYQLGISVTHSSLTLMYGSQAIRKGYGNKK